MKDVGVKENIKLTEPSTRRAQNNLVSDAVSFQEKPVYDFVKRIFDIVASLLALIVLSPLLLLTMIAIYIDDPGPIFFKQIRIGKGGEKFVIYKFRSMRVDAEVHKNELAAMNQGHGATFEMKHDPRRTRSGKFLRKSSIDELPQLLNVLKSQMSIIGPRPFIPEEQAKLPSDRLLVKPGLSCYWQIGGKNSLSEEEQIELDRKYIRERSMWTDIKIVFKTIFVVFHKGNR